ncbi:hydroxymethylbilane synthase [Candidatus Amarobacter glycogenicus]|uniref:hydroxymethylbilane synthase n=1 Tax=Candidatus Amarobacter glycogenicus TaxID=3140699 RepID=UPI003135964B|nr:hydroxymethylbilane synthase [Dehalococcoidia bacterium]
MTTIRIATRGSRLALIQTGLVADLLRARNASLDVDVVTVVTAGDRDQSTPLQEGERAGWFTSAIQDALTRGEADIAVHSYKDLPTKRPDGLTIAAVPLREDPRDALVSRLRVNLRSLPAGAIIGTSSPRRTAQILELRPDLEVRVIRGNVETRVAKVESGEYDATVLALAGLRRLGLEARADHVFGYEEMLPSPAQGALAVECRSSDSATRALLATIDDATLRQSATAERTFLAAIDGGCSFPAAAHAEHFGTTLKLSALIAADGRIFRSKMAGSAETAAGLGRQLAEELMSLAGLEK